MDLDNTAVFSQIDSQDMLAHIDGLPDQMQAAWEHGRALPLPAWTRIERVLIAGVGGSAIGADLVASYVAPFCPWPVVVHRNYGLPAWARGKGTLVIVASHSGNTEEALSAYESAGRNGCRLLVLATGGKLAALSEQNQVALWRYAFAGQPRAAVGYNAILLLAALHRLSIIPDPTADLADAIQSMRTQQESLRAGVPAARNPAKRMAGQLVGRWVTVVGADVLEPVARRWKAQFNELAKAWAQFEALPEVDHNTLAGAAHPQAILANTALLFLRAPSYHPRNQLRARLTKMAFMLEGLNTDFIDVQGPGPLAHQWSALHFGDYTAYYLAMAYGVDPTPIEAIESLKKEITGAE